MASGDVLSSGAAETLLVRADQAWEYGELLEAHDGYAQALAVAPDSWHAALQLAWIDAAFAPLEEDRLAALDRPGLPPMAAMRLDELRDAAGRLPGSSREWGIKALQRSPRAQDARFWEECAARAAAALQFGLSYWCYAEAAELAPNVYFDMPSAMRRVFEQTHEHLAALRLVDSSAT